MSKLAERPNYRECIVTFFDILGFRELMASKQPSEIAESLMVFRKVSGCDAPLGSVGKLSAAASTTTRVEIVSDAIVRVTPNAVDPLTNMTEHFNELIILKEIQSECLQRGLLLRGATTIGPMYLHSDQGWPVFGPGLVGAFELESREVIYPRIAVHSDAVERYRNDADAAKAASYEVDREMVSLLLTQDGAGHSFVDCVRVIIDDQNWGPDEVFAFLQSHRILINQGLRASSGGVRRKYTWLHDYHNKSIDHLLASNWICSDERESTNWEALRILG